eukprot:TRINITY_DN4823_c0_g3_i2.p1 TRINITY_DN4823_c0_g3~~TRINITY_DN4823_c0_g3_i2.p1  ORF type:complete len:461 (+),score=24.87 TRINITY_DN4823_c0_g3_i2:222-1604(+)
MIICFLGQRMYFIFANLVFNNIIQKIQKYFYIYNILQIYEKLDYKEIILYSNQKKIIKQFYSILNFYLAIQQTKFFIVAILKDYRFTQRRICFLSKMRSTLSSCLLYALQFSVVTSRQELFLINPLLQQQSDFPKVKAEKELHPRSNAKIAASRQLLQMADGSSSPQGELKVNLTEVDGESWLLLEQDVYSSQDTSNAFSFFESVIGENDLKMIRNTTSFPFNTIGRFQHLGCTGFLIEDYMVLTSAYCVYDRRMGQYYFQDEDILPSAFDFTPGQNGPGDAPFGTLKWAFAVAPAEYRVDLATTTEEDLKAADEYDFALVILKDSFIEACEAKGDEYCGFMSLKDECRDVEIGLNLAGYRQETELGANLTERLWVSKCQDQKIDCSSYQFNHTCDTTAGMAGAPLWIYAQRGNSVVNIVRGIHSINQPRINRALTLTTEHLNTIRLWVEEAKLQLFGLK